MKNDGTIARMKRKVISWSPWQKVLALAVLTIIIYGTIIALDGPVIEKAFGVDNMFSDVPRYRDRTETILHGGLLYRDVLTETPPLINYLLIPAELLGGSDHTWVYCAYFSFFGFLGSCALYLGLRRYDDYLAFMVAAMFLASPFGFLEAGTGEDETIVAFLVIVPAILMLKEYKQSATVATVLGIWTKMWTVLLLPIQFLRRRTWKDKMVLIGIVAVISIAVTVPFLVLCGSDFSWFLKFYFLGVNGRQSGGTTVWHFLIQGGIDVPSIVELAVVGASLLLAYLYAYRMKMGVWQSITLAFVVFFVVYPKMCTGYYLMPVALLLVWGASDIKIAARCFLLYVPVIASTAFAIRERSPAYFNFPGAWIVGIVMVMIANLLLLDTARIALKKKPFIEKDEAPDPAR